MAEDGYPVKLHIYDLIILARGWCGNSRRRSSARLLRQYANRILAGTSYVILGGSYGREYCSTIPSYILELPNEVMNSPIGALIMPMIQGLETTLRAAAAPRFRPAPAATQTQPSSNNNQIQSRSTATDKTGADKTTDNGSTIIPPAVQPAPAAAQVSATAASPDPLREAKNRVQEEIKREFAAIMATGDVQAGEAAALATRRVMERHSLRRAVAMQRRG